MRKVSIALVRWGPNYNGKGNSETALAIGTSRTLTVDRDHELRAYASQVMRVELTEEYDYSELADPCPVEGKLGTYDLYVQVYGESSDGYIECIEWTIRLSANSQGKVLQLDFEEEKGVIVNLGIP